ncbi:hypothetical protein KOW79_016564 [Hemibagrus wyckioides]|uniref:Uncharacterized protein n=1 Tax=Hemibagrus wyckioides TaxID=337641 RepID=A0A9D3N9T5_9TELE|nr:hypothetical protein KOW79_016564 [Hemibagrus wyckioides]
MVKQQKDEGDWPKAEIGDVAAADAMTLQSETCEDPSFVFAFIQTAFTHLCNSLERGDGFLWRPKNISSVS